MSELNGARYRERQRREGKSVVGRNRATRDGLTTYCRPCHNQVTREQVAKLHGNSREYHLRRRYGIGNAEFNSLVEAQGGVCAACREQKPEHVDHDHVTGEVRGVLCFSCNGGLGLFRDRIQLLERAIDYLRDTNTWQKVKVSAGDYQ